MRPTTTSISLPAGHLRPPQQSVFRISVIVVLFTTLIAVEWLFTHEHEDRTVAVPRDYSGLIRLAPDQEGRCQQFQMDNMSGLLTPIGTARCDGRPKTPDPVGPRERLNAISDYFKSR